jgi:hypothetical protein
MQFHFLTSIPSYSKQQFLEILEVEHHLQNSNLVVSSHPLLFKMALCELFEVEHHHQLVQLCLIYHLYWHQHFLDIYLRDDLNYNNKNINEIKIAIISRLTIKQL